MGEGIYFDYYYGMEAEQFSFLRVPKLLIKDKRFKGLSSDAKLLYGLMLDRMALSVKNRWFDDDNRAYIYYTVEEIMDDLGCSRGTCIKIMAELDNKKGIGLVEKKRQGLGRPDIIYVKNFVTASYDEPIEGDEKKPENADISTEVQNLNFLKSNNKTSRSPESELPEVQNLDFCNSKNRTSGNPDFVLQEVQNLDTNNTDINNTDIINNTNLSINLSKPEQEDKTGWIDNVTAYIRHIKQNIRYDYHMQYDHGHDRTLFDELYELIVDTVCVKRKSVKIGGEDYPYELVKSKFLKLTDSHLEYVITAMQNVFTKINNIKSYMLTALYNAPNTIAHYYQQLVQHDMDGGWEERGAV